MSTVRGLPLLAILLVGCATAGGDETSDGGGAGSDASIDARVDASPDAPDAGPCSTEVCNGSDDDCDGAIDEDIAPLECGVGECGVTAPGCVNGVPGTCTPGNAAAETCNNLDDDCDGTPDNKAPLTCGKGICFNTAPACVNGANGTCTPGTPQTEVCNSLDDNCDGTADNLPPLSCGVGQCATTAPACMNGADNTCTPGMPTLEVCSNGLDEDCNGSDLTPPSNKTCPSWLQMTSTMPTYGDNTCSGADITPSPQNDCIAGEGTGNDQVYAFGSDGSPSRWTVTMTGPAGYDTLLHVHSSTNCNMADQLACSDDAPNINLSQVVVDGLPEGGGYYVVADSWGINNNRAYTLTLSGVGIALDTCSDPAPIRGNGAFKSTTASKANNYTPPASCSSGTPTASPDVVYSITARSNGTITASTSGTNFDTMLYVSTSCGSGSIACSDDYTGETSRISWSATAGTTYYIIVDGYDSAANGAYTLTISGY